MAQSLSPQRFSNIQLLDAASRPKTEWTPTYRFVVKKLPDYSGLPLLCAALQFQSCHYPGLRYVRKHRIFVQSQARGVASRAHFTCQPRGMHRISKALDWRVSLRMGLPGRCLHHLGYSGRLLRRCGGSHWPRHFCRKTAR